jgi:hypothetical protein
LLFSVPRTLIGVNLNVFYGQRKYTYLDQNNIIYRNLVFSIVGRKKRFDPRLPRANVAKPSNIGPTDGTGSFSR